MSYWIQMRKIVLTITKWIGTGVLCLVCLFLVVQTWFYFTAPIYIFEPPKPFSGERWYNPYAGMDSTFWKKANFHFHTREWFGLTAGKGNTNEEFWRIYKSLGYDAPMISNYMRISKYNKDSAWYLGVYEHGVGVRKKHQILIGSGEVLWRDYSLFQNMSHRQHIIDLLRRQNEIVALAHPGWDDGYPAGRIGMLSNYDLLEALDGNYRSIPLWDSALSAGRPVFILADDDAHNINDPGEIGVCVTFINARENNAQLLVEALKAGRSFGADVYCKENETWDEKILYHTRLMPKVNAVELEGDTLRVRVSDTAMKIEFIGQSGVVKKEEDHVSRSWYVLQKRDTYIRTQITFYDPKKGPGTKFYLNPVFRYNGEKPVNSLTASVNNERTWIFRFMSFGSLFLLTAFVVRLRKVRRTGEKDR
jgi:hypothetical protein